MEKCKPPCSLIQLSKWLVVVVLIVNVGNETYPSIDSIQRWLIVLAPIVQVVNTFSYAAPAKPWGNYTRHFDTMKCIFSDTYEGKDMWMEEVPPCQGRLVKHLISNQWLSIVGVMEWHCTLIFSMVISWRPALNRLRATALPLQRAVNMSVSPPEYMAYSLTSSTCTIMLLGSVSNSNMSLSKSFLSHLLLTESSSSGPWDHSMSVTPNFRNGVPNVMHRPEKVLLSKSIEGWKAVR